MGISAYAGQLVVGDAVPVFSAKDQFGKEFSFTNGVQFLLIATEMACGKTANHKLAEQGAGFLEKNRAIYLMDIHTMPAIARVFALPKTSRDRFNESKAEQSITELESQLAALGYGQGYCVTIQKKLPRAATMHAACTFTAWGWSAL